MHLTQPNNYLLIKSSKELKPTSSVAKDGPFRNVLITNREDSGCTSSDFLGIAGRFEQICWCRPQDESLVGTLNNSLNRILNQSGPVVYVGPGMWSRYA